MAHQKVDVDKLSGVETTGHEWDGLKELNNPLPKWWLYVYYICIAWSVVYWVFYPAWPLGKTHTEGLYGYTAREAVLERIAEAKAGQAVYLDRIAKAKVDEIRADPDLLNFALAGGRTMFNENCAACHAAGGQGRAGGFPVLADDDWLWGGTSADIYQTIRAGIRAEHPDTRMSLMPAFGADKLLEPAQIADVAQFVLAQSNRADDKAAAERGKAVFADQCASCHGPEAKGMAEVGAPNLTDDIWLYGNTAAAVRSQVTKPRHGVMPAWSGRLDDNTIKQLAVYVYELGGGK